MNVSNWFQFIVYLGTFIYFSSVCPIFYPGITDDNHLIFGVQYLLVVPYHVYRSHTCTTLTSLFTNLVYFGTFVVKCVTFCYVFLRNYRIHPLDIGVQPQLGVLYSAHQFQPVQHIPSVYRFDLFFNIILQYRKWI